MTVFEQERANVSCLFAWKCPRMYVCMYTCMYVCLHIYVCVCVCIYVNMLRQICLEMFSKSHGTSCVGYLQVLVTPSVASGAMVDPKAVHRVHNPDDILALAQFVQVLSPAWIRVSRSKP